MNRQEILNTYNIDKQGIIRSLGRFELENIYTPYFWNLFLNGEGEELETNEIRFDILSEDIKEFPELKGYKKYYLYINDNGFIYGKTI